MHLQHTYILNKKEIKLPVLHNEYLHALIHLYLKHNFNGCIFISVYEHTHKHTLCHVFNQSLIDGYLTNFFLFLFKQLCWIFVYFFSQIPSRHFKECFSFLCQIAHWKCDRILSQFLQCITLPHFIIISGIGPYIYNTLKVHQSDRWSHFNLRLFDYQRGSFFRSILCI